jgi:acyl carrier protein
MHIAAVLATIAPEADLATIDSSAPLREQLDIDSMDFLRLLTGLHARTGVSVPESDYAKCATLDGLERVLIERTPTAERG